MNNKKILSILILGIFVTSIVSAGLWDWMTDEPQMSPRARRSNEDNLWDTEWCDRGHPCGAGEGDCDSSRDCLTGYCASNVGADKEKPYYQLIKDAFPGKSDRWRRRMDVCECRGDLVWDAGKKECVEERICTDSDGGLDYYEKGEVVRGGSLILEDSCLSNGITLHEKACKSDGEVWTESYDCSSEGKVCKDGACVEDIDKFYGEAIEFRKIKFTIVDDSNIGVQSYDSYEESWSKVISLTEGQSISSDYILRVEEFSVTPFLVKLSMEAYPKNTYLIPTNVDTKMWIRNNSGLFEGVYSSNLDEMEFLLMPKKLFSLKI